VVLHPTVAVQGLQMGARDDRNGQTQKNRRGPGGRGGFHVVFE
jgi:hypothetical protein